MLPTCRDLSRLVSEARDSGRPLGAHARLHLWVCEACRRFRRQLDALGRAAAAAPEEGPSLAPEAKARLKRLLEGGPDGPAPRD